MKKLLVNQEITLENKHYKIIGIDHYRLKNVIGSIVKWDSYTFIDNRGKKIWISYHESQNIFVQWIAISKAEFKKKVISAPDLELTGLADITFEGNAGYSTPTAEVMTFSLTNQEFDYIGYERFLKQKGKQITLLETYYDAGKILKDFKYK